jgi:hypothetical protein
MGMINGLCTGLMILTLAVVSLLLMGPGRASNILNNDAEDRYNLRHL